MGKHTHLTTKNGQTSLVEPPCTPSTTQNSRLAHGRPPDALRGMKAMFTPKEYARLLELVHLGLMVAAPRNADGDDSPIPTGPLRPVGARYAELVGKLFDLAKQLGCADLVDVGADGRLIPAAKLAEDERVQKLIGEYNNDTFWHELVTRLADRDLAAQHTKQALAGGGGPPLDADARLRDLEDAYWEEFEENDLTNLVLLRGGKG